MRWTLAGLLWIAACYSPSITTGVPCADNNSCPLNQTCSSEGKCVGDPGPGIDAAIDTSSADDRDGDEVVNAQDNCPDIANRDQANEDSDRFGDRCDPCPPDRNDTPNDPDGDGVADSCDPSATTPGDAIELFEGFHQGVPAWSPAPSPNWAAGTGEVLRVAASESAIEWIVLPSTTSNRVTVTAGVFVEQFTGTDDHQIGIAVPYEASTYEGIGCDIVDVGLPASRFMIMWDDFNARQVGYSDLTWATSTEYRMQMARRDQSYTCTVIAPSGDKFAVSGTSSSTTTTPSIALRAYAVTARVPWVMIVRSP